MGEGARAEAEEAREENEEGLSLLESPTRWNNNLVGDGNGIQILQLSEKLINGNLNTKIEAAREIRKLVRKSSSSAKTRSKFAAAGVIQPLVFMLSSSNLDARESSLLALLNLAVRNERYSIYVHAFFNVISCIKMFTLCQFSNGFLWESHIIVWFIYLLLF